MRKHGWRFMSYLLLIMICLYVICSTYLQILIKLEEEESASPSSEREYFVKHDQQDRADIRSNRDNGGVMTWKSSLSRLSRQSNGVVKSQTTCGTERHNFVFIKCMKCATETMAQLLRRFGLERNLSFVIPAGKNIYLGWPFVMSKTDYRPKKTNEFNIVVEHSIYNKSVFDEVMPEDTKYITIIREPYSHFKSVFNYFSVVNVAKVPGTDPVSVYLRNIEKYDAFYRSHEAAPIRFCIPDGFSITKNLLSYCLGMPLGFPQGYPDYTNNDSAILNYIQYLDKEFSLIMLVEYFYESLVLLRRFMCWSVDDMLHKSVNILSYKTKYEPAPPENVAIYKKWSRADYLLYDHFYKVFWRRIREQSDDFFDEVKYLYQLEEKVTYYCYHTNETEPLLIVGSAWNDVFQFERSRCKLMDIYLLQNIKQSYDSL